VLETLKEVYKNDAKAKELGLSPEERLYFHQAHSQKLMEGLEKWAREQIEQKKVEPNSGLGQAINYMLKRWEKLTLFLRKAGVPLDNNICNAASGITNIMPRPVPCRVAAQNPQVFSKSPGFDGCRRGIIWLHVGVRYGLSLANPVLVLNCRYTAATGSAHSPRQHREMELSHRFFTNRRAAPRPNYAAREQRGISNSLGKWRIRSSTRHGTGRGIIFANRSSNGRYSIARTRCSTGMSEVPWSGISI